MKRITIVIATLITIIAMCMGFSACTKLSKDDGIKELKKAYELTEKSSDIYQFQEKIYLKATENNEGYIINRRVNVNCDVDKHYELIKDKNFAINIHEDKYTESIDSTSKITNKMVAYNDIMLTKTDIQALQRKAVDSLIVGTGKLKDGKMASSGYIQADVDAKTFYNSSYFEEYKLMNKSVMQELKTIINSPKYMDFDIKKGGIEKKGVTTDYTFKVTKDYLDAYKKNNGKASVFNGKYVWIQTSYGRIANIYVYDEENLGGVLNTEYESYIFMITYLGPHVVAPKEIAGSSSGYKVRDDMFDISQKAFDKSVLLSII